MSRHLLISFVMMVILAVVYGSTFTVNRLAADAGVPPIAYAFWQSLGAAIVLLAVVYGRGDRLGLTRAHLVGYFVIGALALGLPISLLTYVAPKLPAGALTLLLALSPPLTYVMSMMAGLDRFRVLGLVGLLFGFAGVAVLIGPSTALGAPGSWAWYLLALVAPVMFAGSNVGGAVLRPPVASSVSMASGVLFGSAATLVPLMAVTGQLWAPIGVPFAAVLPILGAMAVNVVGYVLFFEMVRRTGPTFFSQFNYLAVLCGVGWGVVILGEQPSATLFAAMLLMFAGVFISSYRGSGKTEASATPSR